MVLLEDKIWKTMASEAIHLLNAFLFYQIKVLPKPRHIKKDQI